MIELADLLELLHTSDERWRTIRMKGREWRDEARLLDAFHRAFDRGGASVAAFGRATEEPAVREEPWSLWIGPEDKVRAEFSVGDEPLVAVLSGDRWWHWSPSSGGQTDAAEPGGHGTHGTGPGAALLETAVILPSISLEITGFDERAGRTAVAVTAKPEASARDRYVPTGLHGIGSGADEYRLLVDEEIGVFLRVEARTNGQPFRVLEIEEVGFDESFTDATFELELPPGEAFSAPIRARDDVALDRLPGLVPFTILVPEHPPIGTDPSMPIESPTGSVTPAMPRWNMPELAQFSYDFGDGRLITLRESAEALPIQDDQVLAERDDLLVGDDGSTGRPIVRLRRSGTYIELEGAGVSLDELIELAATLVPLAPL